MCQDSHVSHLRHRHRHPAWGLESPNRTGSSWFGPDPGRFRPDPAGSGRYRPVRAGSGRIWPPEAPSAGPATRTPQPKRAPAGTGMQKVWIRTGSGQFGDFRGSLMFFRGSWACLPHRHGSGHVPASGINLWHLASRHCFFVPASGTSNPDFPRTPKT